MADFDHTMNEGSFVIECFNDFYSHVLNFKTQILTKAWEDTSFDGEEATPGLVAGFVLSRLKHVLEEQALHAAASGADFAQGYYAEAQFVMVALADEVFLNLEWDGQEYWESHLLEQSLFNTHSAGQVFYNRLDDLLTVRDPVRSDVAEVYQKALGLGFRGKYRGADDHGIITQYLERLYVFINRRKPSLFTEEASALFPQPLQHTLEAARAKNLPNARNWHIIFGCIGLVYLIASYLIWYSATYDIARLLNHILRQGGMI